MEESESHQQETSPPKWKPLGRNERRILGVLVEKAKTTPGGYPMSLNAVVTGCNQKSNRSPLMSLSADQVEEGLDKLRGMHAVGEVFGGGRVSKYRHYMKDWMGVDGTELAVMTELMLRGPQSLGDLRGRAARMAKDSLPDINALRPIIASLIAKSLVIELTPEGRGQFVTHGLFSADELNKQRRELADGATPEPAHHPPQAPHAPTAAVAKPASSADDPTTQFADSAAASSPAKVLAINAPAINEVQQLRAEVAELSQQLERLKKDVEDLWANVTG